MPVVYDLQGRTFGKLQVKEYDNDRGAWKCLCDCGNVVYIRGGMLRNHNNTSCGHCKTTKFYKEKNFAYGIDKQGNKFYFDLEDFDRVSSHNWYMRDKGYFYGHANRTYISLHRFVMNASKGTIVDHKDRNPANCRKSNLRFCTRSTNEANKTKRKGFTSKYKGVCWDKSRNRWLSYVRCKGKLYRLGTYKDEKEAAVQYNIKAKELFGEFAVLNKI